MADDEGTDVDITHDVFLIHANEPKEDKEFALLKLKPLLERQNLKVLVDEEDFRAGECVLSSIARAVRQCRKSLMVLTKHSQESPWCSLELQMALEKSQRHNIMSVVVLRKGNSVEQEVALDILNYVPHVDIRNDNDINDILDELVSKIKERKHTEEHLPAASIVHSHVWCHYLGLLKYILPDMAACVERTEIYKKCPTRFSKKLYELVPENCQCPRVIEDIPKDSSEQRIIVMTEKLQKLPKLRSGSKREPQMTIYCVRDTDGSEYYCVAEYPAVIAGLGRMIDESSSELRERRIQAGRFYHTLSVLLRHEGLKETLNKAKVIMYNENTPGFVLADVLIKAIKEDLYVESFKEGMLERPLSRRLSSADFKHDAFLLYGDESRVIGTEIIDHLKKRSIKLVTEDQREGQRAISDLEYVVQNCYWTIVILTRKTLKDRTLQLQLISLLESFLEGKKNRLIPVLVDTRHSDIPDAIQFVTYVVVDKNKRYLERLYCALQEKDVPFDEDTLIPAGNVAYGLAWTYVWNYLAFVLKGLDDSIFRALKRHNKSSSIYKEKVYILVPFSCDCKVRLSDADNIISYLDTIRPVFVDHSGNRREYSFDMYTFFDKDEEFVFVGQYAATVTCLYEMWRVKIAGLSEADKIKQAKIFCEEIQTILAQKLIEYAHYCEIVFYDDRKYSLSEEMTRRLKHTP
ncbi:uncharacterized protein [Magallana gigas]